jgi:cyclophilin family peptidyl-prolyl cis-trans isomerase
VQEAALGAVAAHRELAGAAVAALADALSSPRPGLVATAADLVRSQPDRLYDNQIGAALRTALARPWAEDLVETRVALLDAALAVGLEEGRAAARAACQDPNATVRARASKVLAGWREGDDKCAAPVAVGPAAPELLRLLGHPSRVTLETDAGTLSVTFDPILAPVSATRFVALARSGFYVGVTFHRVVPGFVVQFGDPGGDGYGGSGATLRCETSPVPFDSLDVGVALAGRDTGSSQIFVALARHPHLDGEYAWVGRAEGDWSAVADGDVIRAVRVDE